jgi:phospholipid-binding lipoprotein MlaA
MVFKNGQISIFTLLGVVMLVTACSQAPNAFNNDPLELVNRKTHELNKFIDSNFISPISVGYSALAPDPLENSLSNFSGNLSLPGKVVNNVLQLDLKAAGKNLSRFIVNSSFGLLGIFDPANKIGLYENSSDFGQTLHRWGFNEGAYIELPLFGASNFRDGVGRFVDMALLDPSSYILKEPVTTYRSVAGVGALLQARQIYSDQIDAVLYESADSYAQNKLIYLQRRRFQLKDEANEVYIDPYSE